MFTAMAVLCALAFVLCGMLVMAAAGEERSNWGCLMAVVAVLLVLCGVMQVAIAFALNR